MEELHESQIEIMGPSEEQLAVHESLSELEKEVPETAEIARFRYFTGMTGAQIAEALDISTRTVERQWAFARAWLKRAIRGDSGDT